MRFVRLISSLESVKRFRVAVLMRLLLGLAFLLAAPSCRQPAVVQLVGIVMLLAAGGLLVVGRERLDTFLAWWLARPRPFVRSWSILAFGFGALLIYSGA